MVKKNLQLILLVLLMVSCKTDDCDSQRILNKSISEISKCLQDSVASDSRFFISAKSNLYEFQNGLLDKIKKLPPNDSLEVRQIRVKHRKSTTYIWLESSRNTWVVFDVLTFSDNTKF
ncbi:MAG TPA: hypothetical protein VNS58_00805 [Puia sp.]|nr:hypothetical protein [Puia sp.]